ncbi:MAG TPA: anti-sigma factor [Gaiellaceae bacterium]|nr:anti-sigma factor [Gaiellaceae bacterium]
MGPQGLHELSAAYALDALEGDDLSSFEEHLARCDECRESVAAFQEAAAGLAHAVAAPLPPAGLRLRVLEAARGEGAEVVVLPRRRRWAFPVAAAAAVAAGALSLGLAFWAADIARQLDDERAARHLSEEAVLALSRSSTTRVPLDGANGALVVDRSSGEGWLVVLGLEEAPESKTYEAWVIEDGEAVAAGLFPGGGSRTVVPLTVPVPAGAVVAVTIEEAGGVEQSTEQPVFVSDQTARRR